MSDSPERRAEKLAWLEENKPYWRSQRYDNGQRIWADDGTLLNERGTRSIFDDVDE